MPVKISIAKFLKKQRTRKPFVPVDSSYKFL